MSEHLTQQEMFDRAWRGLRSQGWEKSVAARQVDMGSTCVYLNDKGRRCAWGWVDPDATGALRGRDRAMPLSSLRSQGIGLAANLSDEDYLFASALQNAHDAIGGDLEERMRLFAKTRNLTIPED